MERDLSQNTVTSHLSCVVLPTAIWEAAWMPTGGGRVKVLFGPVYFELLLGGRCGCVFKTRQTEFVFSKIERLKDRLQQEFHLCVIRVEAVA